MFLQYIAYYDAVIFILSQIFGGKKCNKYRRFPWYTAYVAESLAQFMLEASHILIHGWQARHVSFVVICTYKNYLTSITSTTKN